MEIRDEPAISVCLECGGRNIVQDLESGEVVCGGCGLVIAEPTVSMGPEWRAFTMKESQERTRVGLPLSLAVTWSSWALCFFSWARVSGRGRRDSRRWLVNSNSTHSGF